MCRTLRAGPRHGPGPVVQRGMVHAPRPLRKKPVADMEEELAKGGACAYPGEGSDDGDHDGGESPATVLSFHLISKVLNSKPGGASGERRTGPDRNFIA